MLESIVSGAISGLTIVIGIYAILKTNIMNEKIHGIIGEFLEESMNNEGLQKNLYGVGAIIGNGLMAGTGFKKGVGKFSFKDLTGQIVGSFLQKYLPQQPQEQSEDQWQR